MAETRDKWLFPGCLAVTIGGVSKGGTTSDVVKVSAEGSAAEEIAPLEERLRRQRRNAEAVLQRRLIRGLTCRRLDVQQLPDQL